MIIFKLHFLIVYIIIYRVQAHHLLSFSLYVFPYVTYHFYSSYWQDFLYVFLSDKENYKSVKTGDGL